VAPDTPLDRYLRIRRVTLAQAPTPVQELKRLREHLGCPARLFIKRDDYTGPGFGGNKVRKLEYYFGKALAQGRDVVITCGGERSNHCRITAAVAAQLGLECHLVLNRPPRPWPAEPATLWLDGLYGAEVHTVDTKEERAARMEELAARFTAEARRPLVIPLGASTSLGALGFVRAIEELKPQLAGLEARVEAIVHATASGGTQAGLCAGLKLHSLGGVRVLGICADGSAAGIRDAVRSILAAMEIDLDAPACWLQCEAEADGGFVGEGYGIASPEGDEALRLLARREGILLDPVYTAKAFAGLLHHVREGSLRGAGAALFWHTGGQMALFSVA
jgi:D-cysteine desulfhydrase family pyridoxal phosphate-dependent enzyme